MLLAPQTRLGPYEIVAPIGAGGMGEVYKAKDTRLERVVAIKILPERFSGDPQSRERFEREARTVASLNHPHICVLHDIGQQDGIDYLVMEFLEGEPLRGPLPIDETLRYAIQIADALDGAHRKGITHRDLKPGNIIVTRTGVKLLDFGLAKTGAGEATQAGDAEKATTKTRTLGLTQRGTILGTPQYMAPEQVEGRDADARSDIFAFGALLYEMLSGRKAFEGRSQTTILAAILAGQPAPISAVIQDAPAALDRLVKRCLAKDPDERWQTVRDLKAELEWIAEERMRPAAAAGNRARVPGKVWAAAAIAATLAAAALIALWPARETAVPSPVRFQVGPPAGTTFVASNVPTISPDGRHVVFVATPEEGEARLYIRALESLVARPVQGTEGARAPFWSPDGRSLVFRTEGKLKRVDLESGSSRILADATAIRIGAWSPEGVILFSPLVRGPLHRVLSTGGPTAAVTKLEAEQGEISHRYPQFLPDGKRFLLLCVRQDYTRNTVELASLDSAERRVLMESRSGAVFARMSRNGGSPEGYLLFLKDNILMAQRFDEEDARLSGEPVPVAENVAAFGAGLVRGFTVSNTGVVAYLNAPPPDAGRIVWLDREGKPAGELPQAAAGDVPALSPDGSRLAVAKLDASGRSANIWVTQLDRNVSLRLTFGEDYETAPVWSPDGRQIAYAVRRGAKPGVYAKDSSGATEARLLSEAEAVSVESWSPDGQSLTFYRQAYGPGSVTLYLLPLAGDRKPIPIGPPDFLASQSSFSPDGRYIAYTSNESGRPEIYVRPVPPASGKWLVSSGGGAQAAWRGDGRELFYLSAGLQMMSVEVRLKPSFEAGVPRPLFRALVGGLTDARNHYAVTADGKRFLTFTRAADRGEIPFTVLLNWHSALRRF